MKLRFFCVLAALLLAAFPSLGEEEDDWSIVENVMIDENGNEIPDTAAAAEETVFAPADLPVEITGDPALGNAEARADFIERIIALGKEKFDAANGKAQRAYYSGDIYVCKNFTVYLFRQNRDDFRIAAYPDQTLVIPNNLPSAECKPYAYGLAWENIAAADGNPFYEAASFRYDKSLSEEENMENALAFMRQVQRGDYFQMTAKYEYGTGAHSAIMISDYDPSTDTVHWMDSNMRGKKINGIRYGIVQFDEEKAIQWWADCFCQKTRGATLYRLREDIVYASDVK